MGFLGNVSNRIRDFFRNDKSQVAAQIAKGATAAAYPTNSYDILQSYGYDVLQDSLRLENDLLCVSGDTRVLVLNDGPKWVPIRDLAEEYKDKPEAPIYTLSFDTQSKRIVCSEAYRPRRTKHDQVFYVVMTGSSTDSQHSYVIKATADHPFLMRDGSTYCKVKDLKPGDSVMPAGVSVKEVNTWPYWYVFQPFELTASGKGSKQVKLAHLVVERTQGRRPGKGEVVHHINQDKLCDAPWNLEIKGINAHHADHSTELWADPAWRASQVAKVRASKSNGVCPTLETRKFGVRAPRHNIPVELLRKHLNESTSINEVARQLGVNWWTVRNHMSRHGIPMEELGRTSNHRVVAILPAGAEDVYDLTVPQYQNFAAEGVIIHNSKYVDYEEMGETPLIASALDIYADDASQTDSARNRTIWVTSQDQTIADLLGHDLFHKTLRMDEEIWEIARTMVSMGNDYEELLVTQDGVKGLNFLAPPTVRRIEGPRGELHGFIQDYKGRFGYSSAEFQQIMAARTASIRGGPDKVGTAGSERITALEDWEVVHFRLRSKHRRAVYGSSALESARWIWKRLMLLEDSALRFRLERAPERYAFYVDVGDLPPNEAMAYLNRVRQQHRKKRWVNPNTGKMDLRFDPMPVSDTTPIPLLDGRVLTIAEMCKEHEAGIKHWVYSVDPESKKMVPGEVSWVGQTRQAAPTVRITFDDGGYADMAPDHPVMRRSGEYAQAGSLQPGDSVMPLYREISSRARGNRLDGYELTYDPHSTHYRYTHRWVAEALGPLDPAEVVHHRDCSRLNNDPRNLQPMSRTEHTTLHASMGHLGGKKIAELRKCRPDLDARLRAAASAHMKAYNCSPEKRALTAIQNKKRDTGRYIRAYNASEQHERDNVSRSRAMTALWADPARREAVLAKSTLKFPVDFVNAVISIVKSAPHIGAEGVVREVNRGVYRLLAEGNTRTIPGVHRHLMLKMYRKLGYADFASFKSACLGVPAAEPLNHKVVSVEHIGSSDQYCMTVEKWHNFALLLRGADGQVLAHSGVVVRNSNDEDFVIPTRQGADGTRIEVLGSPSWQSVEDLNYFRDMLFAAIKVPRSYFSQEDGANKNTLSAGDVRFARTILRVQRELKNGLGKIARVHLAALNIDPEAVDYDIHMMVPSSIFELAQLEVKNARADLAGRMQGFVSMHWILSTVFGLSDDEIKVIFKEKEEDAARDANLQANTQSVIQRAVAQAGMEGQAAGQVASQDMMAQLAPPGDPNAPAAPAAAGQPAPQEGITGAPAIHIKGARPIKRLYGLEQKLFEGHNKAFENEARDKLNTIMRTDRRAAGQLKELGAMLRELNHAVKGIKR